MKTKQANMAMSWDDAGAGLRPARGVDMPGCAIAPDARARGLTLLELIVAVSLLSIMIMTFGIVISSANKMVTLGEASIRSNAMAAAISQVIKNDLRRISQSGFLCITQSPGGQVQVFFTTAGPANSLTGGLSGDGAIVGYGLTSADAVPVLWRAAWLMNNTATGANLDALPVTLPDVQKMVRYNVAAPVFPPKTTTTDYNQLIKGIQGLAPTSLPPILVVNDLGPSWKYLGQSCANLSVMWTQDGVNWYGLKSTGATVTPVPSPSGYAFTALQNSTSPATSPEFTAAGNYRALWAHDNQSCWPKAIKISFSNNDPLMPADFRGVSYEVICLLGK